MLESIKQVTNNLDGSGFCCESEIVETKRFYRVQFSYHVMDENGYYRGYAYFTVAWEKSNKWKALGFKVSFNGRNGQHLNRKFYLRDFIEESFVYAMGD